MLLVIVEGIQSEATIISSTSFARDWRAFNLSLAQRNMRRRLSVEGEVPQSFNMQQCTIGAPRLRVIEIVNWNICLWHIVVGEWSIAPPVSCN